MAHLHITLKQEEILVFLSENRSEVFTKLLQNSINGLLKAESATQICAEQYERSEERPGSRNGFRDRLLSTRIGTIKLKAPKNRNVAPWTSGD